MELRRQQPAENIPAAAPGWTLVSALVPFMAQGACGLQGAEQHRPLRCLDSQALFHISLCLLLLVIFESLTTPIIPMDGLRYRASQSHTWSDDCNMSKLVPVPAVTSKARRTRGGSESCPLRHLSLAPCAVSGEKLLRCLQGIGTIYHA